MGGGTAYQSDGTGPTSRSTSGRFQAAGLDARISTDGGSQPRWNPTGKELFYVADDDRLMAVPVTLPVDATAPEPGTPTPLFATNIGSAVSLLYRHQYKSLPATAKSFVMHSVAGASTASPITVILNWKPGR